MLYSNNRKLILSGWLQKKCIAYHSPLRLQKFLFFYETFSKAADDSPDFTRLKGYKRGPVFSSVWGDYTKDRMEFDKAALDAYNSGSEIIDENRARRAGFIVSSLSEIELSELTHKFNIWNSKAPRIMAGEQHVELYEDDFNDADLSISKTLEEMYPDEMVHNSIIIPIDEKYFVFSKNTAKQLTEQHMDTLSSLAMQNDLHNPVFVEIDETGGLCVD